MAKAKFRKIYGKKGKGRFIVSEANWSCGYIFPAKQLPTLYTVDKIPTTVCCWCGSDVQPQARLETVIGKPPLFDGHTSCYYDWKLANPEKKFTCRKNKDA